MKKLILSSNQNHWRKVTFLASLLMILLMTTKGTSQNVIALECQCQNNATSTLSGLFQDRIQIVNAGAGPWAVIQGTGLYTTASTPSSLTPLPIGTNLTPSGSGTFILNALRLDRTSFSIVISDGVTSVPITSNHLCKYPGPVVIGDKSVCVGSEDVYSIDSDASLLSNINWTISAGGTFLTPNGGKSRTVKWGNTTGLAILEVSGQVAAFPGQGTGKCNLSISQPIPITNESATAMACNNHLFVSMNNSCEFSVTPSMVLEDMRYSNASYEIVLRDIQADTVIPNGRIAMQYLDKVVEVKVVHECTGNSCWGLVTMEDKNIPDLVCTPDVTIQCDELPTPEETGFPVPDDAIVTKIRDGVYTVINFDKCTPLTLRFEDYKQSAHCNGPYSAVIGRRWSISDGQGNTDTCSSRIFILKATIDLVTFPENYDDVLGPNLSLVACGNYPKLPNGYPDPYATNGTGAPTGVFCLNVQVEYTDTELTKCGNKAYKLRREWVVVDLCQPDQRKTHTQLITVMDNKRPVVNAPVEFSVGTSGTSCGADIKVPPPIVIFECSDWDYFVSYKTRDDGGLNFTEATTVGVVRNTDNTYTIKNIPENSDSIWIVYTVVDACQNVSQSFTEVAITDDLPPVPVCDRSSFVGLNNEGIAWAGVGTFDDGSIDNCGIEKMEIRRMNQGPCGDPLTWSDKIKFCCADVGVETMVQLRVTDRAGNSNTCMVFVTVQDNIKPTLKDCPGNRTVNCDADVVNLAQFGRPTVEDLCGATLSEQPPVTTLDNCGRGMVVRTFVATDKSGNTATCSQTISVSPTNPFTVFDITWPINHTVANGCMDSGIKPSDLPGTAKAPSYPLNKPCSNVTDNYEDIVFQFTDGACFKVLRKWTVIDWCAYNNITGAGIYTHTQVIMVNNSTAPSITKGCSEADLLRTDMGDCRSRIQLSAEATDDCSLPTSLKWRYEIDVNDNGVIDFRGNGSEIDRIIDHGDFRVFWFATDECDNTGKCNKLFRVTDTKKPTPYCLTEIVTVIMQTTKEVAIWASDFNHNNGSFDNCTPKNLLKFSFEQDTTKKSRVFKCAELTDGELIQPLRMYVTDQFGNFDFCTVTIRVQDNSNNCGDSPTQRVAIGGHITNETQQVVNDIQVQLSSNVPEGNRVKNTDAQGVYKFEDLTMYNDYTVDPKKAGDYRDGISTLDLVLIQRHILEITPLASAYKVIAADINADDKVTASDLVELRKLILGITNEFSKKENWRFIDKNKTFVNPNKPFPYKSPMTMTQLDHNLDKVDFIAMKVGDVNNSHKSNFTSGDVEDRADQTWTLTQTSINGLLKIAVETEQKSLSGFQFAIEFDPELYYFEGIEAPSLELTAANIGLSQVDQGRVYISWSDATNKDIKGELMNILLSSIDGANHTGAVSVNPGLLAPEAYTVEEKVNIHPLTFRNGKVAKEGAFELYQNIPNPFNDHTVIGFSLETDSDVTLRVFDYSGKVLVERNERFTKGYNSFDINVQDLNASGIMYYQIDTKTHSASKKMIVIK